MALFSQETIPNEANQDRQWDLVAKPILGGYCRNHKVREFRTLQAIIDVGSWNRLLAPCSSSTAILKRERTALQHVVELPERILDRFVRIFEAEVEVSQGMIRGDAEPSFSHVMLI